MIRRPSLFAPSRSCHRAAVLLTATAMAAMTAMPVAQAGAAVVSEAAFALAPSLFVPAAPGPRASSGANAVLRYAPASWSGSDARPVVAQRAIRSARRSAAAIVASLGPNGAAHVAPADATPIDWRVLAGLDYQTGTATDTLKKLEGKEVRIPGFVVPLDDFMEDGAEFLLVPYYGACVHTPPPPPNQIIFVQMAGKKSVKLTLFDAVWMYGKLKIATVESPYGTVGFTLEGMKMEPYSSK